MPAERAVEVEALTGVPRRTLRPDLYDAPAGDGGGEVADGLDAARAAEYRLLAHLLLRAPDAATLTALTGLRGDPTPLGMAHLELAEAAAGTDPGAAEREYFDLFFGLGRGELLPYASWYLTGFLHERPLGRVREDLARLGPERAGGRAEPGDHLGTLLEVMAGLGDGAFEGGPAAERAFFDRHLAPWAGRCFGDLERAASARFYRAVGALGRVFIGIEAEAFALSDDRAPRAGHQGSEAAWPTT